MVYNFIQWILFIFGFCLVCDIFIKDKRIKRLILDYLLLITYLIMGLSAILILLKIEYNITIINRNLIRIHVLSGVINLVLVSIHIYKNRNMFIFKIKKIKKRSKK